MEKALQQAGCRQAAFGGAYGQWLMAINGGNAVVVTPMSFLKT